MLNIAPFILQRHKDAGPNTSTFLFIQAFNILVMSGIVNWGRGQLKTYTLASLSFYTSCADIHYKSRLANTFGNAKAHFSGLVPLN